MAKAKINSTASIIWVDSDPNIRHQTGLLEAQNWRVACFNETADALDALRQYHLKPSRINCVITSMMERDGRRERGLLNGLQMLDEMKIIWKKAMLSYCPLIAIISLTADEQECKEHGAEIVVLGDRAKMLREVINRLNRSLNSEHREKWREPSLLPCLEIRAVAKAYLDKLNLSESYFDRSLIVVFVRRANPNAFGRDVARNMHYLLDTFALVCCFVENTLSDVWTYKTGRWRIMELPYEILIRF